MSHTHERSLSEMKRETELTRAGLAGTVNELRSAVSETANDWRQRISPDAVKAEVGNYFRSRGEQLVGSVTDAARENPLQAIAVGAGVAFPLLRLARAIPMPVLMIGAGLFFAGSKRGQNIVRQVTDAASDLSDQMSDRVREAKTSVGQSFSAAKDYASDQLDSLTDAASSGANAVKDKAAAVGGAVSAGASELNRQATSVGESASRRAGDWQETASSAVKSGIETAGTSATTAASTVRSAAAAGADFVSDATGRVRTQASDLTNRAGRSITETFQLNPLLIGGIGLAIGALIASSLPPSDTERQLMGDASDGVKDRARNAASHGLNAMKDAAVTAYDDVTRRASDEGLTADGLKEATQDMGQRVRKVAENAVSTAFELANQGKQ